NDGATLVSMVVSLTCLAGLCWGRPSRWLDELRCVGDLAMPDNILEPEARPEADASIRCAVLANEWLHRGIELPAEVITPGVVQRHEVERRWGHWIRAAIEVPEALDAEEEHGPRAVQ